MKIEGQHTFDVPAEVLWNALLDPEILSKTLPGCQELTQIDENEYKATLSIGVGPVQGKFDGDFSLSDLKPIESYHLKLSGKGPSGFVEGEGDIRLENLGESTILHYQINAQVGGTVAGVGQRLLDSVGRSITRQGLEQLHELVKAGPSTEDPAAVDTPAPSIVGGGFFSDMAPRERRIMTLTASFGTLFIVLMAYFRACGS